MSLRPLHDRVLIRRVGQEEKTRGGILIPDTAQEKPMEGEIVAVGPGSRGEDGTPQLVSDTQVIIPSQRRRRGDFTRGLRGLTGQASSEWPWVRSLGGPPASG